MHIEDYGLTFTGKKHGSRAVTIDEYLSKIYVPQGKTLKGFMSVFWHGKLILRIAVRGLPSIQSVSLAIDSLHYDALSEECKVALGKALPDLINHGKKISTQIKME